MNYAQKKLVTSWLCIVTSLIAAIIINDWVMSNWDWLSFVLLGIIGVGSALLGREQSGWGSPGIKFGEFISSYPKLQIWMAVYTFCISVTLITLNLRGVKLHEYAGTLLVAFFVPLLGPAIAVGELKRYKRLGLQSNKPFENQRG
jgi:hypothetical protein